MIASVLIEYSNKKLDKTFDYIIPTFLLSKIKIGMKVKVPFSKVVVEGFVLNIKKDKKEDIVYKEIIDIIDSEFILDDELLSVGKYIKENTFATLISCYQIMLPKALKAKNKYKINVKYEYFIKLKDKNFDIENYILNNKRNKAEIKILNDLKEREEIEKRNYNLSSINSLIKKDIITITKYEKNRLNLNEEKQQEIKLTEKQEKVYNEIIKEKEYKTFLLHGVTGSGKTEVYIKVIKEIIKEGRTAIMLVPEISLTPQITKRFISEFSSLVAVLHSRLSEGEKYDEYRKILRGEVKIVIGARSAVFAPLKNLGVIIIDEEHSQSYKQESMPRYNAIDVAIYRGKYNNAKVILGSATPMLETYTRAKKGVYKLLTLNERINKNMPKITLIDSTSEYKKRNFLMSEELENKINERLAKKEQVILLLNRRGHSTFVNCTTCGYVYKCPNCDISLTYHKNNNTLRCHYCGYTKIFNTTCPKCHEKTINNLGMGTEKLEEKIKEKFKNSRIVRMDIDTTSRKGAHSKIIEDFKNNKYDILVGTQMISKGLNFPNVTLVGILSADSSLNLPDFRSGERTFQLLSQTAGRSGRNEKKGEVIIETFNPDNYVLQSVKNNDYIGFCIKELQIRKQLKYPPYYYLMNLKISSYDYNEAKNESFKVLKFLKQKLDQNYILLGPTTASMFKINKKYRFSIIIKYRDNFHLYKAIKELNEIYINSKVNIEIDNNPMSMV